MMTLTFRRCGKGHLPQRLVQMIDEKAAEKVKQLEEHCDKGMD